MKTLVFLFLITSITATAQVKNWYQSAPDSKYGVLTQNILEKMKATSPRLFEALDTLGIPVFVKVMDEMEMCPIASGLTTVKQAFVLIHIAYNPACTRTLAHEFGHAYYNFSNPDYDDFYKKRYLTGNYKGPVIGHDDDDESGKMSDQFTKMYLSDRKKR